MANIPPSILRQPPPPRSQVAANKEAGNTEMVGGNCTRTYYLRKCEGESLTNIESLPDELLFEVLLRLPAQDIYDPARLVCRRWYHMIHTHNFIYAHLQRSTYGLLFQSLIKETFFMAMRQGQIEISKFRFKFRCPAVASCNGLMVEYEVSNCNTLYISNPATRQIFVLPSILGKGINFGLCAIAYAAASMEYKVVIPYPPMLPYPRANSCYILTVGLDNSWRIVRTEHLSFSAKLPFANPPLITEGFLHWHTSGNQVLTLNVETEIITETPPPIPRVYGHRRTYLTTGRYLSLLITCREFFWEVWEMKPETGEWRQLHNISLEAQKCTFEQFGFKHDEFVIPIGWLKYLEVLVFAVSGHRQPFIFLYNLLTQEIDSIELPASRIHYSFMVHRNSLVWLGGC